MGKASVAGAAEMRRVGFQHADTSEPVLRDHSWEIDSGSFNLIVGSSGSGKSTLLRLLNGLVPHFSGGSFGGRVSVSGLDTLDAPTRELSRHAGFVFQDADSIAISGRVEDEIAFGMEQLATPAVAMRRQVEELLMLLGIEHLRKRMVTTLSGGERQRVAIAAAMAMNPELLILDEPTSQLDPSGADDVIQTVHRLNHEHSMTIVVAEHRLERILPFADTMTMLRRGLPAVQDTPRNLLSAAGHALAPSLFLAGERFGWTPRPLTVREGRQQVRSTAMALPPVIDVRRRATGREIVGLSGVELRHDQHVVLRQVDFAIHAGEIVAVMGANGSGKTTLLRSMIGLHTPARGEIQLRGTPVSEIAKEQIGRIAGFLPQRARALFFNNSVLEELQFSLRHRNMMHNPHALLEEFGLCGLEARHPHDLSAGEQESLALALTLAGDPPLVVLDEPTRGIDAPRKRSLIERIASRTALGQSFVLSTHDVEFAAGVADRVILLGGGEIIADGSAREIMDGSFIYGTQLNKVFGNGILTLADLANTTGQLDLGDTDCANRSVRLDSGNGN